MSMARYEVSDALSILLVKSRVFRDHSQDEFERKLSIIMGENLYFQEERENGFLVFSFNAQDHGTLNFPLNHDQKNYLWQRIGVYELRYGSYTYERSDSYQQQLRIPTLQISNSTAADISGGSSTLPTLPSSPDVKKYIVRVMMRCDWHPNIMALKEQLSELLSVKLVFIGEYPSSSGTIEEFEADADDLAKVLSLSSDQKDKLFKLRVQMLQFGDLTYHLRSALSGQNNGDKSSETDGSTKEGENEGGKGGRSKSMSGNLETKLMQSAKEGDYDEVVKLLEKGADPNCMDLDQWTPLMWASYSDHVECVKILLKYGADPNKAASDGSTALILAAKLMRSAKEGDYDEVVKLLEKGADPNCMDLDQWIPLMWASYSDHAERLKKCGADPDKAASDGSTALTLACRRGNCEIVGDLLDHLANSIKTDVTRKDGFTALILACHRGKVILHSIKAG